MTTDDRLALEAEATRRILDFLETEYGDAPSSVIAGATMRVAVKVIVEMVGFDRAEDVCTDTLANVLQQVHDLPNRRTQ